MQFQFVPCPVVRHAVSEVFVTSRCFISINVQDRHWWEADLTCLRTLVYLPNSVRDETVCLADIRVDQHLSNELWEVYG